MNHTFYVSYELDPEIYQNMLAYFDDWIGDSGRSEFIIHPWFMLSTSPYLSIYVQKEGRKFYGVKRVAEATLFF